jgi:hypothetical protein
MSEDSRTDPGAEFEEAHSGGPQRDLPEGHTDEPDREKDPELERARRKTAKKRKRER